MQFFISLSLYEFIVALHPYQFQRHFSFLQKLFVKKFPNAEESNSDSSSDSELINIPHRKKTNLLSANKQAVSEFLKSLPLAQQNMTSFEMAAQLASMASLNQLKNYSGESNNEQIGAIAPYNRLKMVYICFFLCSVLYVSVPALLLNPYAQQMHSTESPLAVSPGPVESTGEQPLDLSAKPSCGSMLR